MQCVLLQSHTAALKLDPAYTESFMEIELDRNLNSKDKEIWPIKSVEHNHVVPREQPFINGIRCNCWHTVVQNCR